MDIVASGWRACNNSRINDKAIPDVSMKLNTVGGRAVEGPSELLLLRIHCSADGIIESSGDSWFIPCGQGLGWGEGARKGSDGI